MGDTLVFRQTRIGDDVIEAALAETEIISEMVQWWDAPDQCVTVRIQPHWRRYVETTVYPHMAQDDIVIALEIASRRLDRA